MSSTHRRLICVMIVLPLLFGCFDERSCRLTSGTLDRALERLAAEDRVDSFSLADVASFGWDRVYIFGEYTSAEYVREATLLDYQGALWGLFDHVPEHHALVVFTLRGTPVCHELMNIPGVDEEGIRFADEAFERSGIARDEASFHIERSGTETEFHLLEGN